MTASTPATRWMLAVLTARPGQREALRSSILKLTPHVQAEEGCLTFIPFDDTDDPDRFFIYEVYVDDAAFERHLDTDHVRAFRATTPEYATDGTLAAVRRLSLLGPVHERVRA